MYCTETASVEAFTFLDFVSFPKDYNLSLLEHISSYNS